uniref:Uncharacterized protein n=1 Tax=Panagrolaimus davidi TaxID=227884 RepID=A0A914Q078_9BILA
MARTKQTLSKVMKPCVCNKCIRHKFAPGGIRIPSLKEQIANRKRVESDDENVELPDILQELPSPEKLQDRIKEWLQNSATASSWQKIRQSYKQF